MSHNTADVERGRSDQHRPSGRHGGPAAAVLRWNDPTLPGVSMESYSAVVPFDEALKRLRRALSRSAFEILRECDIGWRLRAQPGSGRAPQCRILYVIEPDIFATAVSTHASAALWLPISLVVCERENAVTILLPEHSIVRDRASLLGLRALVEQSYDRLAAALATVSTSDAAGDPGSGDRRSQPLL